MASEKISQMTAGNPALVTDAFPINRGGTNYRVPLRYVLERIDGSYNAGVTNDSNFVDFAETAAGANSPSLSTYVDLDVNTGSHIAEATLLAFNNDNTNAKIDIQNNGGSVVSITIGTYTVASVATDMVFVPGQITATARNGVGTATMTVLGNSPYTTTLAVSDGVTTSRVVAGPTRTSIDVPQIPAVLFANRPVTPGEGMILAFTNSSTTTWGATIADGGGGGNYVLAFHDGTNWTVLGK